MVTAVKRLRTKSPEAVSDNVQNHTTAVKFYIGSSPSMAKSICEPDTAGVMVSMSTLWTRKSMFNVGDWILDSGAFTEVARNGGYIHTVKDHYEQICKWSKCGNLLCAVAQDWMCEPFVVERTGLSVREHQKRTIARYDELLSYTPPVQIMPVLQGFTIPDYLTHLQDYGERLPVGAWVGIGSVCRRNGEPNEVYNILRSIKLLRPDLRLHGFGLKLTALAHAGVRELLYSADSMAWNYPQMFGKDKDLTQHEIASKYQGKVQNAIEGKYQRTIPATAGAGNGQGRKGKWKTGKTKAIRVPVAFADKLLEIAKRWDNGRE